ncbi:MAG: NirA family protein [Acidimicrobiales bacterium]
MNSSLSNDNGAPVNGADFSDEQKNFLQGFVSGCDLARAGRGLPTFGDTLQSLGVPPGVSMPTASTRAPLSDVANADATGAEMPDAIHWQAADRFLKNGKTLCAEEKMKREANPLDAWGDLQKYADENRVPKGLDVFRFKTLGLFYVAPAQTSFMCRLRFHGGIVAAHQLKSVANIAREMGGDYADITTRANLQIREIDVKNATRVLAQLQDAGIVARGSGADNIRNITGAPTAGIDPQEVFDTRELCAQLHHHILNHRELYGLPRKFNIAFDGGGAISSVADTNDIGFLAVRVGAGMGVPEGVYFRVQLGGITGHGDFARDTGLLIQPEECVPLACAMVRVFIEHGDRTDRKKARLKYLLDDWGFEKFLEETGKHLAFTPARFPLEECEARPQVSKHGHIGVHPQKQNGLFYIGVLVPVGRLTYEQMIGLARLAGEFGSGTIRLTVWQNLLLSDIKADDVPRVLAGLQDLDLTAQSSNIRGALIACTGNKGCRFAASDTKGHARHIADTLEPLIQIDAPLNIHLTGCPNSCAQHYIGDIGMLGAKVEDGDELVEGYHLYLGGGYGDEQNIAREVLRDLKADDAPRVLAALLQRYQTTRQPEESFGDWSRRHSAEELQSLAQKAREAAS